MHLPVASFLMAYFYHFNLLAKFMFLEIIIQKSGLYYKILPVINIYSLNEG